MTARNLSTLVAVAFAALILGAGGGPGWGDPCGHVVLAARGDHLAASPLYDALAGAFTLLPVGEPGFRLGILAALLGALTLGGVVAAARALLPNDPVAGVIAAVLLVLAPAFRDAAAFATPSLLAAAAATWATACCVRFARDHDARDALAACALAIVAIGSTPWLGVALAIVVGIGLARASARPDHLAFAGVAAGLSIAALWLGASGRLPGLGGGLASLASTGRGAGAIVLGAGLLGATFAAVTAMPRARWLVALIAMAIAHEAVIGGSGPVVLALLAIGIAIIPAALVRVAAGGTSTGVRRHAIALVTGLPLVGVAVLTGAAIAVDDPAATPVQLAHDLADAVPPGAGIVVATRSTSWLALEHEMTVAGMRPDLALAPPLPPTKADALVADTLRDKHIAASDVASFGRLDVQRAIPRGRGFQLVGDLPPPPPNVVGPAHYATPVGAEQAILLALERARFEAANGRLDAAARALGLEARFGAADLAVLGATAPSPARPALFGFLPTNAPGTPVGTWLLDTFGDDLAWVAGLSIPPPSPDAPMPRRLHALWRDVFAGARKPDDPEIAALGPAAIAATHELFTAR